QLMARRQVQFTVDPKTPLKDLLPRAPKTSTRQPALLGDDPAQAPEVDLQDYEGLKGNKAFEEIARQVIKINHVNKHTTDHFMTLLLEQRGDLRGLPFLLGE